VHPLASSILLRRGRLDALMTNCEAVLAEELVVAGAELAFEVRRPRIIRRARGRWYDAGMRCSHGGAAATNAERATLNEQTLNVRRSLPQRQRQG